MHPTPDKLSFPLTPYHADGYKFRDRIRRRIILWATHLGDDIMAEPGTPVAAAGDGQVVWSAIRPGSAQKRNWGGLVVVGHTSKTTGQPFFTLYGHLTDLAVAKDNLVTAGQTLGVVAKARTPENGWWQHAHLHFALYTGEWTGVVPPGWYRPEQRRTSVKWWQDPQPFIDEYNAAA